MIIRLRRIVRPTIILFFIGLGLYAPPTHAAGAGLWSLGIELGPGFPSDSSQTLAWGLQITRRFSPVFSLEFGMIHYGAGINTTSGTTQVNVSTSHTFLGVRPAYTMQGSPGLWQFGLWLGTASSSFTSTITTGTSTTPTSTESSHSNLFFGPSIAYDLSLIHISSPRDHG